MIKDEFAILSVSRQRKYQLRMKKQGKCQECGKKASDGGFCKKHSNRYQRKTVDVVHLGKWIAQQRELHKIGLLPEEKVKQLESLPGFNWND